MMIRSARLARRIQDYCSAIPQKGIPSLDYLEVVRASASKGGALPQTRKSGVREIALGALHVSRDDGVNLLLDYRFSDTGGALYASHMPKFRESFVGNPLETHLSAVEHVHRVDAICALALFEAEGTISLLSGRSYRRGSVSVLTWVVWHASQHGRKLYNQVISVGAHFAGTKEASVDYRALR